MNGSTYGTPNLTGAIVFARYDSARLYGKVLKKIAGRPMLDHVLARVQRIQPDLPITLATTNRSVDKPLADWAELHKISVFRGSLENVTNRAVACGEKSNFSGFIRVCADRPFLDPIMNRKLLQTFELNDVDLATNAFEKTFPNGAMAEVIRIAALQKVLRETDNPDDLEHVTPYIYRHAERFRIKNLRALDNSLAPLNLAVDTYADLCRTRWVAEHLDNPITSSFDDIVELTKEWHAIMEHKVISVT